MPIVAADTKLKYTTKVGAAGNANTGTAAGSLGKYISTTEWAGSVAGDLFDDVTGVDNRDSIVDYRCLAFHNSHATLTATDVKVWLSSEVAGGTSIAIGVDPAAASAIGSASAQGAEIATELAAPAGVTFTAPTTEGAGISLGNVAPGQTRFFWIRRTAANTAAVAADGVTFGWGWDTL